MRSDGAEDAAAIREAAHAGVAVVATAHASSLEDARGGPFWGGCCRRSLCPLRHSEPRRRGFHARQSPSPFGADGARADAGRLGRQEAGYDQGTGAVLIIFAGTLIGFLQASRFAKRPRQLRELGHGLHRLETEIGYGTRRCPKR